MVSSLAGYISQIAPSLLWRELKGLLLPHSNVQRTGVVCSATESERTVRKPLKSAPWNSALLHLGFCFENPASEGSDHRDFCETKPLKRGKKFSQRSHLRMEAIIVQYS